MLNLSVIINQKISLIDYYPLYKRLRKILTIFDSILVIHLLRKNKRISFILLNNSNHESYFKILQILAILRCYSFLEATTNECFQGALCEIFNNLEWSLDKSDIYIY